MAKLFRSPWLRGVIKWGLLLGIFWFVGRALASQLSRFDWRNTHFRPLPLILAALCLTIIYAARTASFKLLLTGYARLKQCPPPRWSEMAVVAWIPQLAKYIPGQVVSVVGAVTLLRRFGIGAAVGLSVVLVMDGLAVLTGLVTGSPLLMWEPVKKILPYGWVFSIGIILVGIIALLPGVMGRLMNWLLVKTKRPPLESMPPMRNYVGPVLLGFVQWGLAGLALWLTARSVTDVAPSKIWLFTAIGALGYSAGYISPLPGGLLIRDGIFQATLMYVIGGSAAVAVITIRVIQTLVEVVMALAGMIILRRLEAQKNTIHE